MRILDSRPLSELSMRTVAKEAGVTAPSLYNQFADSEAMMREIVRECWRQMGAEMALLSGELPSDQPLERLRVQMTAYVRYAMHRPSRYQLLFALPLGAEADVVGFGRPVYEVVLATVAALVERSMVLPTDDMPSAVLLALSIAHGRIGLAHLALSLQSNSPASVEAFVLGIIGRLFEG